MCEKHLRNYAIIDALVKKSSNLNANYKFHSSISKCHKIFSYTIFHFLDYFQNKVQKIQYELWHLVSFALRALRIKEVSGPQPTIINMKCKRYLTLIFHLVSGALC